VPANTGLTSASAGKLFKPSGYLLSLALAYYNTRNLLVKEYIDGEKHKKVALTTGPPFAHICSLLNLAVLHHTL
jgi:hypothetical protein